VSSHPDRNPSLRLAVGQAECWCIATPDVTPRPMCYPCLPVLSLTWADLFDTHGSIKYIYPSGRIAYRTPDKDFKQNGNNWTANCLTPMRSTTPQRSM
jgi:hypothetical protein